MRSLGASPLFSCVSGGGWRGGRGAPQPSAAPPACTPCLHPLPAPPASTPCLHPLPAPPASTPLHPSLPCLLARPPRLIHPAPLPPMAPSRSSDSSWRRACARGGGPPSSSACSPCWARTLGCAFFSSSKRKCSQLVRTRACWCVWMGVACLDGCWILASRRGVEECTRAGHTTHPPPPHAPTHPPGAAGRSGAGGRVRAGDRLYKLKARFRSTCASMRAAASCPPPTRRWSGAAAPHARAGRAWPQSARHWHGTSPPSQPGKQGGGARGGQTGRQGVVAPPAACATRRSLRAHRPPVRSAAPSQGGQV